MPEWIIEEGIGETRAALLDDDDIIEARVRRSGIIPAGTVIEAKLVAVSPWVTVEAAGEQFLMPHGAGGVSEGARLVVEVTREALGGAEPWKRGLARRTDEAPRAAPPLVQGTPGRISGWDDMLEEARGGIVSFEGGELRIEPTSAMTMIDVDGWLAPDKLAQAAARAVGRAIRRFDLGGSIGIDFPTLRDKASRAEVDTLLDKHLAKPFERTAMNGFGFVQVVRPRARASLIELARDRIAFEARVLLRRAASETGPIRLAAAPSVVAFLEKRSDWTDRLARQVGGAISLRADPSLPISGGYAEHA